MHVVVAVDSFKGSLSATEAGNAVKEGILRVFENADVNVLPLADGGEGTVEAIISGNGAILHTVPVRNPLGKIINGSYAINKKNKTRYWLVKEMQTTYKTVNKLCDNTLTGIQLETIEKLCQILECTPSDLFTIE